MVRKPSAKKWCPGLCQATLLGSYCLTEPGSGSDAGSLRTAAVKKGGAYVLNGNKAFVSGAGETDVLVVMARTGEAGPKGISTFVVPAKTPGVSYGENEKKMGWKSQPTRIINFDNVEIPADHMLGKEGEGFKIAMKGLDGGRINIGTCSVGTAQAALNRAKKYMHERKQFGKTLAEFQALQFKMADMVTELVSARLMIRMAASKLDNNDPSATTFCAMAKRFATDMGFEVCNQALQLFGGYGYIQEYPLERHVRDVRVHQILEGTNEIMRVIISRKIPRGRRAGSHSIMENAKLKLEIINHTAVLTLTNPPANTFDLDSLGALPGLIDGLNRNREVYSLIVTGEGEKFFSAGADLKLFKDGDPHNRAPDGEALRFGF